ncbi:hypothetical protein KKF91_17260, partial [Myxococcota bacterium]|nr:hypothetical protein [Myxococcota bacterium]
MHQRRAWSRALGFLITALLALPAMAQLEVTAIPWVQSNPEIPHPALNGMPTMLQAIAEGGDCGGTYSYRWDWNGDGDYDDAGETAMQASSANYASYFAPLHHEVTFPDAQGDRLYYPKVEVTCGEEIVTTVMPVLIRVERICSGNLVDGLVAADCVGEENISMTRKVMSNRAIDRGLWYMFKGFTHRTDDGYGHDNTHTCWYNSSNPIMYGTGHAINAFLRRGHGHGEGKENDPYYRHLTQCGVHAILTTMSLGALDFDDDNT